MELNFQGHDDVEKVNSTMFRRLCFLTCTRPDILYGVGVLVVTWRHLQ